MSGSNLVGTQTSENNSGCADKISNPLAAPLYSLLLFFLMIQKTHQKISCEGVFFAWMNQWEQRAPGRLQYLLLLWLPVSIGRSDGHWWSPTTCANWSQTSQRFSPFCPRGVPRAKLPSADKSMEYLLFTSTPLEFIEEWQCHILFKSFALHWFGWPTKAHPFGGKIDPNHFRSGGHWNWSNSPISMQL